MKLIAKVYYTHEKIIAKTAKCSARFVFSDILVLAISQEYKISLNTVGS